MKKISRRKLLQSIGGGALVTFFGFLSKGCGKDKKLPKVSGEQISLLVLLKAKPGKEVQVKKELQALLAPTRIEAGCINYTMHTDPQDPSMFMFYENWASQAALDEHLNTPHNTAFGAKADDLLEEIDLSKWSMVE